MIRATARPMPGGALFLSLLLLLTACTPFPASLRHPPGELPAQATIDVPFHPQERYQCGPAALAMALNWSRVDTTPERLVPEVYLPARQGSLQAEMLASARRHDRIAYVISPDPAALLRELAAGHPVIVLQNLGLDWYPVWHYAVAIGYDLTRREILLHSGLDAWRRVTFETFDRTWRRGGRWGMLALPASRLPATVEETRYLQAVAALERLQRWPITQQAYGLATTRWPASPLAWLGAGTSAYRLGDLARAEAAYRTAVRLAPRHAIALHNLAEVLLAQGKLDEAEITAETALRGDGVMPEQHRELLERIRHRKANTAAVNLP